MSLIGAGTAPDAAPGTASPALGTAHRAPGTAHSGPGTARRAPSGGDTLAVEAAGLVKSFGSTQAVTGVDLAVARGSIYGLLGPNGAGKTTTVRILATLLAPDGGRARVLGHDVVTDAAAVRRRVALAGQFATVDDDLTGWENLVLLGRLAGLARRAAKARAAGLLTAFGLEKSAARQVNTFSGGMRRRLDLATSIVVRADLFFLDEPTTGLDPASRAHGQVIAEGTTGELKASVGSGTLRIRLADPAHRPDAGRMLTRSLDVTVHTEADPAVLTARIPARPSARSASEHVASAITELARADIAVGEFALGQPSLDEVFLTLTGYRTPGSQEAPS